MRFAARFWSIEPEAVASRRRARSSGSAAPAPVAAPKRRRRPFSMNEGLATARLFLHGVTYRNSAKASSALEVMEEHCQSCPEEPSALRCRNARVCFCHRRRGPCEFFCNRCMGANALICSADSQQLRMALSRRLCEKCGTTGPRIRIVIESQNPNVAEYVVSDSDDGRAPEPLLLDGDEPRVYEHLKHLKSNGDPPSSIAWTARQAPVPAPATPDDRRP